MIVNNLLRILQSSRAVGPSVCSTLMKHTLPDLPYDYNALEPTISAEIMQLHHSKHHAAYVNNYNVAEEKLAEAQAKGDVTSVVALGPVLKFNGGGHINHSIFWNNLSPSGGEPQGELLKAINQDFESLQHMQSLISSAAIGIQGSGWAWLGFSPITKRLQIASCANQDPLQATTGLVPLFGIDVWEHAYYLQYKNVRPDYVKAIWKIVNWKDVAERYTKAKAAAS